ncbi:MAG TPA: MotA/TolQ/ExbB proton channel family protein, partial [Planctomycetota bacterium]|nr:MotA/TolQ/ExbB proton channel family protein [Planctomycetota bacterium]
PAREGSEDRHDEAISLLEGSRSIFGDVLRTGVARLAAGAHATKIILEEAALKEAHRLHRKLRPFSVVETLAPLLGLLGTVYGMITCFENAVSVDTASRAQTLASGIYAALVTTAAGLTVAIPAKVLFHWFESRVDRVIDALEERLQAFLDFYFDEAELATATADDDVTAPARLAMAPASGDGARKAKRRERDELALGGIERTSEA